VAAVVVVSIGLQGDVAVRCCHRVVKNHQ
jgi:hypothetical protein